MRRPQNPMRRSWLDDTDGGWIAHRLKLMVSPSWRHRPIPLVKIIERIEIEHMRHAGKENGHLIVSYDQFERHGVSRRTINPALNLGRALGLLEIRQSGEWSGDIRQPNEYRLTYVPEKDRKAPTDEWEGVENDTAILLVSDYQKGLSAKQPTSAKTCTPPVPKPAAEIAPTSAKTNELPVPERKLPLISGGIPETAQAATEEAPPQQGARPPEERSSGEVNPHAFAISKDNRLINQLRAESGAVKTKPVGPVQVSDALRLALSKGSW